MSEQKCCFKGCVRTGLPPDGFDFYVCDECGEELDRLIQAGYREKFLKHENN